MPGAWVVAGEAMRGRNLYEALGLRRGASTNEVRAAYRRLVRSCHPDLHPGDEAALERIKEINAAYEVLCDPASQAAYDRELEEAERRRRAPSVTRQVVREYYGPAGGYAAPYVESERRYGARPRAWRRSVWVEDLFDESFHGRFDSGFSSELDELFGAVEHLMRRMEALDVDLEEDVVRAYRLMRRRRW